MDGQEVGLWLAEQDFACEVLSANRVNIPMESGIVDYTITLTIREYWYSYGAELFPKLKGESLIDFYEYILEINGWIDGVRIGINDGRIIVTMDSFIEHSDKLSVYRGLERFHHAYQYIYEKVYEYADQWGLVYSDLSSS